MTSIVFVDDEKTTLDILASWFQENTFGWQTHYVSSAEEALQLIQTTGIDCVISDMRMPDMNGTDFLNQVAQFRPKTVRIGMSGFLDAELTLESLHATHRFIAKPGSHDCIAEAVTRSLELREKLDEPVLQDLITGITSLPVLPEIYDRLMLELASDDFSINKIGSIIESDISLSATLLKIVNSPYYGLVQHVESPSHAVNLLGVEVVKNILLSEKVVSQFRQHGANISNVVKLNVQAGIRGVLANRFARLAKLPKRQIDHCQIAGMMSSLGELVIETEMIDLSDVDDQLYHADLIGSSIIGLWSLPDPIVEAVLHQSDAQAPGGSLTAQHILHAVRRLESAHTDNNYLLDDSFNADILFADYTLERSLTERWVDCFCDYHMDLKAAA